MKSLQSQTIKKLIELRRDYHLYPELSLKETHTALTISKQLHAIGIQNIKVAGTGVLGLIEGGKPGKTLLIRADIDALPITEDTGLSFSSTKPGVMHACGHDGHIAIGLQLAEALCKRKSSLKGKVKFLFQPAEETANGAEKCIKAGVMKNPKVDGVLTLHLWNSEPVGTVVAGSGPIFAGATEFTITIRGKGGHGAMPHLSVDAIAVAGQVVTALQNLVSRQVSPIEPTVLTIGTIQGGHAFNVIAPEVILKGTLRAHDDEMLRFLQERLARIAMGVAHAMGAEANVKQEYLCPPVVSNSAVSDIVREAATEVVGKAKVKEPKPVMLGDDASLLLRQAPGCYFLVGSANAAQGKDKPHHSPQFDFDEGALEIGLSVMEKAALKFLS
ncbi:MAG: amidohydrolase [Dehalococcoidia bacterium]|nr:amidohydrolase [Dehalococcoidia bacterium]